MSFFSLIIPVYNVEKYLDHCIKSVIMHNPEEYGMEVILVDDGSTDDTGNICDHYADVYDYIRVIHKDNGGASSARNEGINCAEGEYILFLDSDDWWNPDVNLGEVVSYVKQHEQTEMFLFTSYDYIENEGYFERNEQNILRGMKITDIKNYYQTLLNNGNLEVSPCTKIFKRTFLVNNRLFFREGLVSEDNEWMLRILRKMNFVDIIDQPLFICRLNREGSVTNSIKVKHIEDLLKIIRSSQKYYERYPQHELKNLELCYASYLWFSALGLSTLLSKDEQKLLRKKFSGTSGVCKYSNSPKTRICYFIYRLTGLSLTAGILGIYIRFKGKRPINRTRAPYISEVNV